LARSWEKERMVTCPNCGREFLPLEGQQFCSYCGGALHKEEAAPIASPPGQTAGPEQQAGADAHLPDELDVPMQCPWEEYEKHGLIQGLLGTLRQSLFSPVAFFAGLPRSGGFLVPLLFALIIETVGGLAGYVWGQAFESPFLSSPKTSGSMMVVMGLLMPLIVFVSIVAWALVLHLSLFLVGGAKEDFEATFRVVFYTSGPSLCSVIPIIGTWITLPWRLYLVIIATREVHRITTAKAVVAVILPSIACCGLVIGGLGLTFLGMGLSGS
jgi:hypothetical protein